jgi:hypothetical protein
MCYDIKHGIYNIIRWTPIIWFDHDFDWFYLSSIMQYKLRRMSKLFSKYGHHVGSDIDAKRILICAELLKRLEDESYMTYKNKNFNYVFKPNAKRELEVGKYYQEYLFKLMGKYFRSWWD